VQRGQLDSPQALCHAIQVQGDGAGAGAAAAHRDSAAERGCAGRIACVLRRQRFLCAGTTHNMVRASVFTLQAQHTTAGTTHKKSFI